MYVSTTIELKAYLPIDDRRLNEIPTMKPKLGPGSYRQPIASRTHRDREDRDRLIKEHHAHYTYTIEIGKNFQTTRYRYLGIPRIKVCMSVLHSAVDKVGVLVLRNKPTDLRT